MKRNNVIINPKALLVSWLIAIGVLLIGTLVLAAMIFGNVVSEETSDYGITIIVILTSLTATGMLIRVVKENRLVVGGIAAVLIWLSLLAVNALFFDGSYSGVVEMLVLIMGCSFAAVLLGMRRNTYNKRRRLYKRNC